jgi:hypothetical protein
MEHDSTAGLAPDGARIVAFCAWWFERANKGVLEIGWINARTNGLTEFEQFERNDLNALAIAACQANMMPGQSCYIRAATVAAWSADTRGRTSDKDFVSAPGIWSDIDEPEDFERARTIETLIRPNGQVITGTVPSTRIQSWFRASEPIVSADLLRGLNVRLHALYGGDPSVVNPSRLMRLPGTIAWPRKPGRVAEIVRFVRPAEGDDRPRSYPLSMLTSLLPVVEAARPMNGEPFDFGSGAGVGSDTGGGLTTVSRHLAAIRGGRHWHNNVVELVAHWIGRGWSSEEIMGHCPDWTLPGWTVEQTRREVATAIRGGREKWGRPDVDPVTSDGGAGGAAKGVELLSLTDLDALPPPQWLVRGLVPDQSLIVPYGPPKAFKTFLMLSMGLHVAAGMDWFGHPVRQGAAVYIAGEGIGGMSLRLRAMRAKYGIDASVPFFVVRRAVNLRVPAEVNALEAAIRAKLGNLPLRMLFIDTLARAMPGADENSAQEVGTVIAAADYLKETFACTVAVIHHEGKDGERGARGTSALRGAWDAAFRIVSHGRATVSLTVIDQKDAEGGQRLVFTMEPVQVGLGRESLVPMLSDAPEDEDDHQSDIGGHAGLMLNVLRQAMAGPEAAILPPLGDLPSGTVKGLPVEVWRRGIYEKMPGVEAAARRQAFHRGMQNLMRKKLINVKDPWVWLCGRNEA